MAPTRMALTLLVALCAPLALHAAKGDDANQLPTAEEVFATELTAEADAFLTACNTRFNEKQERLHKGDIDGFERYDVDLAEGVITFSNPDGKELRYDVQVIGSLDKKGETWEWAWNNPHVKASLAVPRKVFAATAKKHDLRYLDFGMVPAPVEDFGWYLSGIALELAGGEGVYRSSYGDLDIYLLMTNKRTPARS